MYMLMFEGDEKNTLKIESSSFDGNYRNSGLYCYYGNITATHSSFHNLYNGKGLNGGGAMTLRFTSNHFSYLDFKNNSSEKYGGSILFSYTYTSSLNHTVFTNSTSRTEGNVFNVLTDDSDATRIYSYNITQIGICNDNDKFTTEGAFFSAFGKFHIDIVDYYGINLCHGPFISLEGDVIAKLYNSTFENIYSRNDGPLIKAINPNRDGVNVDVLNTSFHNIFQE